MQQDGKHIEPTDEVLRAFLEELCATVPQPWERTPDLGLYMDQVIGYVNEQLGPTSRKGDEPILTPSMVNNYVKFGYLDRPEKKRYSRKQLVALFLLCSMKQTLPIPDAAYLISALSTEEKDGLQKTYAKVTEEQRAIAEQISAEITERRTAGTDSLLDIALSLTLRAEAMRLVAEHIISLTAEGDRSTAEAQREAQKAAERLAAKEEKRAAKAAR